MSEGNTVAVRLPDGRTVNVRANSPAEAARAAAKFQHRNPHPEMTKKDTWAGLSGNFIDAMIPGSAGAVRGVREVALNAARAPFSDKVDFHPRQSYLEGQAFQKARQGKANAANPRTAHAIEGAGLVGSLFLPASKIAKGATLGAKAAATATTAGAYGALSGALSSTADSAGGVLADTLSSGLSGASVGAVMPYAFRATGKVLSPLKPIVAPVARIAGRGMETLGGLLPGAPGAILAREGRQLARDPVAATANRQLDQVLRLPKAPPGTSAPAAPVASRASVSAEVARRQAHGVPAVAADVADHLTHRAAAAVRSAGPAVASVRRMIAQRQEAAGSRVAQHVREALGPTANVDQQAEAIRQRAQAASRPLYDEAFAAPGASDAEIVRLLNNQSGAMRSARSHASELAMREGRDPNALGFDLSPEGEVIIGQTPSWDTINLVKQGLQGTADATRNAFGHLNNDGRTIMSMAGPLVRRAREVNPTYGQALDAYGGEIAGREALLAGRESLREGADDLANAVAGMTPYERQNFALGNRSAMATDVADFGRKTPQGNPGSRVLQNFGHEAGETYRALQGLHGADNVDRLTDVAGMEDAAHGTWQALRGSAGNLPDLDGEGQWITDAARGVVAAGTGHPMAGIGSMAKALATGNYNRQGVEDRVASVLLDADLASLRASMRDVGRERARSALVDRNAARAVQQGSRFLGGVLGTNLIAPVDDQPGY